MVIFRRNRNRFASTKSKLHRNLFMSSEALNFRRESTDDVAKVIEFYIPKNFRKSVKWVSPNQRGKIIEFASQVKKSA
jgi:hypothetical protein